MPNRVIASVANFPPFIKNKITSFALLITAWFLSSTHSLSAYTIYGTTLLNGTNYNLSPGANLAFANLSYAADLNFADLRGADLHGANLSYAKMSNANLTHTELYVANVSYATLITADLTGADLDHVDLSYANLSYAKMANATLTNADLSYANLTGANLSGSDLSIANLTYATVSYLNWNDFVANSGALNLNAYTYNTSLTIYAGPVSVPESTTFGLWGIGALAFAFVTRRRKLKTA